MGVHWMQKRGSGNAVGCRAFVPRREGRTAVTTDDVVSGAAGIVRIVDAEFGVIEDVEGLGAKFQLSCFRYSETFGEGHVEIDLTRVVQKIPAGISKIKSTRGDKLGGVPDQ